MNKFIAVEGPDGSGKSLFSTLLQAAIDCTPKPSILIQEPGTTQLGKAVRSFVKNPEREPMCVEAEVMLFNATKHETWQKVVAPFLNKGGSVVADRWSMSTWVYQCYVNNQEVAPFARLMKTTEAPEPDVYIVLRADDDILDERLKSKRDSAADFYDADAEFQKKVRAGYMCPNLWTSSPVILLDSGKSTAEQLVKNAVTILNRWVSEGHLFSS